jgi:hypothetical protein
VETKFYTGIGARATPFEVTYQMIEIAQHLSSLNWILRSGHADGADLAFEEGAKDELAEIWLPWASFNSDKKKCKYHTHKIISPTDTKAFDSINKYHPNPSSLSHGARSLMARNYRQIVGLDSSDSQFVICWTSDGKDSGGTGQALRIARDRNISVYNLYNKGVYEQCLEINY